jgi:deoxycytidylate deaminase
MEVAAREQDEGSHRKNCKHLERFNLHGWMPDPKLSDDENCMDMVMLVTRSSHCSQGSMACVLINQPIEDGDPKSIFENIIGVATNQPLFSENDSDIHAEIVCLGEAARQGCRTQNATAYITMPPCKRCFAALLVAGIRRIVTRISVQKQIQEVAAKHGIEVVTLGGIEVSRSRINTIIHGDANGKRSNDEQKDIEERRKRRKEGKQNRKITQKERCD